MAHSIFRRTMARVAPIDTPLLGQPIRSTDWEVVVSFRGTPPSDFQWSAGCTVDADVDEGTTGEIRLRTRDAAGNDTTTATLPISGALICATTGWELFSPNGTTPVEQFQFLEARKTGGPGAVMVHRANSQFVSSPDQGPGPHFAP